MIGNSVVNDAEYGMDGHPSALGDVYSYGILLLEIFTGKKPTNDMFEGDMGIHQFAALALPNHVIDIIDPFLLSDQEFYERDEVSTEETAIRREQEVFDTMENCLVSVLQIGVSCSATSPSERMPMTVVVNKLHAIKDSYLRLN